MDGGGFVRGRRDMFYQQMRYRKNEENNDCIPPSSRGR